MLVFEKIVDLKKHLAKQRKNGATIGFVPTMGALHKGHQSLIKRSKAENTLTVCSIFVNPTQFNDNVDLAKYPQPIAADKALLEKAKCDILFAPSAAEIYPEGIEVNRKENRGIGEVALEVSKKKYLHVDLGALDKVMEGASRPGHFAGVVQVVSKLFDIVDPDKAYFGQKDFQQQTLIKEMVRQLRYKVSIVACPIVRESDGLAMSSRNTRLTPSERAVAGIISHTLFTVQKLVDKLSVEELTILVESEMTEGTLTTLEYFKIVDATTLQDVTNLAKATTAVACIAVKVGQVRLIDNVILK